MNSTWTIAKGVFFGILMWEVLDEVTRTLTGMYFAGVFG